MFVTTNAIIVFDYGDYFSFGVQMANENFSNIDLWPSVLFEAQKRRRKVFRESRRFTINSQGNKTSKTREMQCV